MVCRNSSQSSAAAVVREDSICWERTAFWGKHRAQLSGTLLPGQGSSGWRYWSFPHTKIQCPYQNTLKLTAFSSLCTSRGFSYMFLSSWKCVLFSPISGASQNYSFETKIWCFSLDFKFRRVFPSVMPQKGKHRPFGRRSTLWSPCPDLHTSSLINTMVAANRTRTDWWFPVQEPDLGHNFHFT